MLVVWRPLEQNWKLPVGLGPVDVCSEHDAIPHLGFYPSFNEDVIVLARQT
jgi:hypothetical protein